MQRPSPVHLKLAETPAQSILLATYAAHVVDTEMALATSSLVALFADLGVSEHATRSMLKRSVQRGTLCRHRRGREVYYGLAPEGVVIFEHGRDDLTLRQDEENWPGRWTIVMVSLPDSQRGKRHLLKSRLRWAGFGSPQDGVWIIPRHVEMGPVLGREFDTLAHNFHAVVDDSTDVRALLEQAYDLSSIDRCYQEFLAKWGTDEALLKYPNPLLAQLTLVADRLLLRRSCPALPEAYLPPTWLASTVESKFEHMMSSLSAPAREFFSSHVRTIEVADGSAI